MFQKPKYFFSTLLELFNEREAAKRCKYLQAIKNNNVIWVKFKAYVEYNSNCWFQVR